MTDQVSYSNKTTARRRPIHEKLTAVQMCPVWNPKIHNRVHKIPSVNPLLKQQHSV